MLSRPEDLLYRYEDPFGQDWESDKRLLYQTYIFTNLIYGLGVWGLGFRI